MCCTMAGLLLPRCEPVLKKVQALIDMGLNLVTLAACGEHGDEPLSPGAHIALYLVSANTNKVANLLGAWVASRHCRGKTCGDRSCH